MERYQLPTGWVWTTLGEVSEIVGGGTPRRNEPGYFEDGNIPWATPSEIQPREILQIAQTQTMITERGLAESSARLLRPGTVLFSSRASIGKIAIAAVPMATNQGFANLTPRSGVMPRYIAYGLRFFTPQITGLGSGTTYLEVAKSSLRTFDFPLAPTNEQQRIVARIKALLAEARRVREALERIPPLLARFRQAVLAAAFRGEVVPQDPSDEPAAALLERIRAERARPLGFGSKPQRSRRAEPVALNTAGLPELPEGWVWTTLGSVFGISLGGTPSRKRPECWNGDIAWASSGEVAFSRVRTTKEQITREGLANSNAKLNPPGTVLLAMIGEGRTRGQAAILDIAATTNQNVAAILCSETEIPAEWVFFWLMCRYQETRGGGSGGAQPALNQARVQQLTIPVAPLGEQRRVIARIEALFAQADAIEAAVKAARGRVDALQQAILARAFRGELVPQDPGDEPAAVLLERIRKERPRGSHARGRDMK